MSWCSFFISVFVLLLVSSSDDDSNESPPNILFILMDDVGWADISLNGGSVSTPNLDGSTQSKSVYLNRHYVHLMCSPSRSQFLTGRYAMHQGIGRMLPWDATEIAGIPIGQPTLANWLRDYGNYKTYAIGKWHLGYATSAHTPLQKGFDHFYGFYQGAIGYTSKKYIDILFGFSDNYDLWNDGIEATEDIETDTNTLYLYKEKLLSYLNDHASASASLDSDYQPFYIYFALQTMHKKLLAISDYASDCSGFNKNSEIKRCENLLLTDAIIGDIIDELKTLGLYDNTLIVFTTDNGGDLRESACNYPLRGSKGSLFDGNSRTVAVVSGGVISENAENTDTDRESLFSSLDWTPTLLQFAGLFDDINDVQTTWDGSDQYSLILYGDDDVDTEEVRSDIVMNIGLSSLESASILFQHNDHLYKYIREQTVTKSNGQHKPSHGEWPYLQIDAWCDVNDDDDDAFHMLYNDADTLPFSQANDDYEYLFDLTADEREFFNLLLVSDKQFRKSNKGLLQDAGFEKSKFEDDTFTTKSFVLGLVSDATKKLEIAIENPLYSEPISGLYARLEEGVLDVMDKQDDDDDDVDSDDGVTAVFIGPFLTQSEYEEYLSTSFDEDDNDISQELQDLYLNEWVAPDKDDSDDDDDDSYVMKLLRSNALHFALL